MATYQTASELPTTVRDRLEDVLAADEEFIVAARFETLLTRLNPFWIVTDRRLIKYRKKWLVGEELSDIPFDTVARIDYDEQGYARAGTLTIEGMGVEESAPLLGGDGQVLADAIRAQRATQN